MEAWEVTDSPNMNRSRGLMGGKYGLFHFAELQLLDWPNPKLFWILKLGLYIYALSNANGSFYLRNIKKKNYLLDEYKKPLDRRLWTGWSRYIWTCFPSPMRFCLPMFITDTYISFKPFQTGYKFWLHWSARYWLTPWGLGMETPSVVLKTNYEFGFKLYSDQYWGAA